MACARRGFFPGRSSQLKFPLVARMSWRGLTVTPVGILLPTLDELLVYGITSKVTSDCLVDRIVQWWETVRERFAHITTLVINLDNGPENHRRRTQFMQRMVEFVHQYHVHVRLAYLMCQHFSGHSISLVFSVCS